MSRKRPLDNAYQLLFSHREVVADLIRGYVDPRAARNLDLATLERGNGSYVSPDLKERRNDVVWRLRSRSGSGWVYVYLLLEFQSAVDHFMAVRILGYMALLWQDLIKQGQLTGDGRLPSLLPIVLYNGDEPWTAPTALAGLMAQGPAFLARYQPQAGYLFLDENRLPTSGGRLLRNLVSAMIALEQTRDVEQQNQVLKALRAWLKGRPDLKESFGTWYAEAIAPTGLIDLPPGTIISVDKVVPMMATRIMKDIKRRIAEGEAKGEAKGEARGEARGKAEMIRMIRHMVDTGVLSVDAGRLQIRSLLKAGKIPTRLAKDALVRLG